MVPVAASKTSPNGRFPMRLKVVARLIGAGRHDRISKELTGRKRGLARTDDNGNSWIRGKGQLQRGNSCYSSISHRESYPGAAIGGGSSRDDACHWIDAQSRR